MYRDKEDQKSKAGGSPFATGMRPAFKQAPQATQKIRIPSPAAVGPMDLTPELKAP